MKKNSLLFKNQKNIYLEQESKITEPITEVHKVGQYDQIVIKRKTQ